MKLQFSITICLSFFTAGWYVVTKGNSLSAVLCRNIDFEVFVLSSLIASLFIKPLFTPGG